jgi:phenylacetate-CoA ligase
LHVNEYHFVLEIIDPESGKPCRLEQQGEIVLTTLTASAFPLIRFRTGDLAHAMKPPCPCGRTFGRISPVTGYTGEVLTIRGVKAHPIQIEEILKTQTREANALPRFLVHLYKENHLDMAEVLLEVTEATFSDEVKVVERALTRLQKQLFHVLGIEVTIKLVEASTLDAYGLPSRGVIDEREK